MAFYCLNPASFKNFLTWSASKHLFIVGGRTKVLRLNLNQLFISNHNQIETDSSNSASMYSDKKYTVFCTVLEKDTTYTMQSIIEYKYYTIFGIIRSNDYFSTCLYWQHLLEHPYNINLSCVCLSVCHVFICASIFRTYHVSVSVCLFVCLCVFLSKLASRSQYLSQIMSDLHETFRISSLGSLNMIQHDPILQISSQEPSMSSKYHFEDRGFLTHFYSC